MYYASPSSINRDGREMLLRIGASANNPVISGTTSAWYNAGTSRFEQRNTERSFSRWCAHSTPKVFVWHRNVILLIALQRGCNYHEAFRTPGISLFNAFNRNWYLQSANSLIMPRPRPDSEQRFLTVVGRVYLPKVFNCNCA